MGGEQHGHEAEQGEGLDPNLRRHRQLWDHVGADYAHWLDQAAGNRASAEPDLPLKFHPAAIRGSAWCALLPIVGPPETRVFRLLALLPIVGPPETRVFRLLPGRRA